jgi:cyclic pyranopterin phosphate synthase
VKIASMSDPAFSHLSPTGEAKMVDVSGKAVSRRVADAEGWILCSPATIAQLRKQALPKGDVLAVARVAGIQGAKLTPTLIPMCHSLPLEKVSIDFEIHDDRIRILGSATATSRTGVEMEALSAVSTAALTLYDMMKAVDKEMRIEGIRVLKKTKETL